MTRLTHRAVLLAIVTLIGSVPIRAQGDEAEGPSEENKLLMEELPLEPGHRLSRIFTEGSWISVDVSPDGTTVVFDFLGDLYTLPLSGGRAEPLTQGMGFDAQPRFSPDGEHVVFTSDRDGGENIWIVSLDGSDKTKLTSGKTDRYLSPEWTPDGDYIIATKGSKLWMWHRDGGGGVQLVEEPANMRTVGAAFGPDDRFIWFSGRVTGGSLYNNGLSLYQLAIYDRNTGEVSGRSSRWGGAFRPALSPDGRYVVYASRHIAQTLGLDGDLGSIEAGKLADLLILAGNPLDDLRNTNTIQHVMMNGRLYEGDSLNEVWPRQRMAAPFYWLETSPDPAPAAGIRR